MRPSTALKLSAPGLLVLSRPAAQRILLPLAAALCGLAWGQPGGCAVLGFSVLVPLLWHLSASRWTAAAVVVSFQLAASRGMPAGTGIFFAASAPAAFGFALWLAMAAANAAPWWALWRKEPAQRRWALPAILVVTSVPPLGIIGWANPLTAAGILYPGTGFVGLALLLAFWLASMAGQRRGIALLATVALLANGYVAMAAAPAAPRFAAIDTNYGKLGSQPGDFVEAYARLTAVQDAADTLAPGHVLVLPETVLGRYTDVTAAALQETENRLAAKHSAVVVGAEISASSGRLDNVLIVLGEQQVLRQRVPIPVGMWRPWADESFSMHLTGTGIATIGGHRAAYLVCYEQLLVFPVLASFLHSPDLLVGAANDWWARDTSAPAIQRQAIDAWGRLFAVPVIRATNL
ncbi:hypothetical protein ACPCHQ_21995 [Ralstonia thomasii]|uniref:hypothetical protein n=1 Tax=Ralstonia thomasii TaxID=3058596 RepID=UPI003C300CE6